MIDYAVGDRVILFRSWDTVAMRATIVRLPTDDLTEVLFAAFVQIDDVKGAVGVYRDEITPFSAVDRLAELASS